MNWHEFHFLQPQWLLALPVCALIVWWLYRRHANTTSAWQQVIEPQFLPLLFPPATQQTRRPATAFILLAIGWCLTIVALANPTWERRPQPVIHTLGSAWVLVLDLSQSMLTSDLTPTRLERAKYKIRDLLMRSGDGQVGLVAFAGAAFTVVPLSTDVATIRALLDGLTPDLMPVPGSRPDVGLQQAADVLRQAGQSAGDIVLLTDSAADERTRTTAAQLAAAGLRVHVLGVGTTAGGIVPGVSTAAGAVRSALMPAELQQLADDGGGMYATLTTDDRDIDAILRAGHAPTRSAQPAAPRQTEIWYAWGPWLALGLLPLAAMAFRRGWLLTWLLLIASAELIAPPTAQAGYWEDVWQRRDQQADVALKSNDLTRADSLAATPLQRGAVYYRQGDYRAAAAAFAGDKTAVGYYNRGNALALAGELHAALAAYDAALKQQPDFADARYNRDLVKQRLEQQQSPQSSPPANQQPSGDQQQHNNSGDQQNSDSANDQQQRDDGQTDAANADQQNDAANDENDSGASSADDKTAQQNDQDNAAKSNTASSEMNTSNDSAQAEQAADDYRQAAAQYDEAAAADQQTNATAQLTEPLTTAEREQQQATDQWLRRIPDDPAALLRRKFLYQYQQRATSEAAIEAGQPW